MIKNMGEFIDRVRTESVSHLWAVKRDSGDPPISREVICDIAEVIETRHIAPESRIEEFAHVCGHSLRL